MKIPYDLKDEEELPWVKSSNTPRAGHFSFLSSNCMEKSIPLSKEYEGVFCIFPSSLKHMVYPFYSDGERRSFSMNMSIVQQKIDENGQPIEVIRDNKEDLSHRANKWELDPLGK